MKKGTMWIMLLFQLKKVVSQILKNEEELSSVATLADGNRYYDEVGVIAVLSRENPEFDTDQIENLLEYAVYKNYLERYVKTQKILKNPYFDYVYYRVSAQGRELTEGASFANEFLGFYPNIVSAVRWVVGFLLAWLLGPDLFQFIENMTELVRGS